MKKIFIFLSSITALVAFSMWTSNAVAYEDFQGGCSSCHGNPHDLHRGADKITANCVLCHTGGSYGASQLTLWSGYNGGNGYGCAGCHGRYYGETIGADYSGFATAALPKASTWGLRRVHDEAGITECFDCHGDQEPYPENVQPPYYADPDSGSNVTDPCTDNLDNDGDGVYDELDPDCAQAVCGNGTVDGGEQCDDGNTVNADACRNDCSLPYCPDGIQDPGETCDDGNNTPGDGCENDCTQTPDPVCGDGIQDQGEACDDGNTSNIDACLNTCETATCGDGFIQAGAEACDDGNNVSGDGCESDCTLTPPPADPACGDGIVNGNEECDNGVNNGDGCESDCTLTPPPADPVCGDGIVNGTEECDNGVNNGNGCENDCTLPVSGGCSEADLPVVTEMEYNRGGKKLHLHGRAAAGTSITILNVETGETLSEGIRTRGGEWETKIKDDSSSLDNIRIASSNGCSIDLWIGDDTENSEHQEDDDEHEEESTNNNRRGRELSPEGGKRLND